MSESGDGGGQGGRLRRHRGSESGLAPAGICRQALDVIRRLQQAGYESYIVGGGVRDLLLGETPKDFDVATAARPEEVRALFTRCRLIGRRFRLAHVYGGGTITEVATFRAGTVEQAGFQSDSGRIVRDNVYGSLEEDALRRDFTINSMYYDPFGDRLVSHERALDDVRARCLRTIGQAERRYREDPVRMLRAVRFLARPGLVAEKETGAQIARQAGLLRAVPPARLFDQLLKLFHGGAALKVYRLLKEHNLFGVLFPLTMKALEREPAFDDFLQKLLACTDDRVNSDQPSTPAFVLAGLWWRPVEEAAGLLCARNVPAEEALHRAVRDVAREQGRSVSAPMRLVVIVREILSLQRLFTSARKKDLTRLTTHPRFRAAFNFFCLLEQAGLADRGDCPDWARIEEVELHSRRRETGQSRKRRGGARRRAQNGAPRRSRRRRRRPASSGEGG